MEISVVIPAFNEEKRIGSTLKKIINYLEYKKYDYEIIVVDDGSIDSTGSVVKSFRSKKIRYLRNNPNMGKGYAVRRGVLKAGKKYVLFSDADLSTPIEELEKFLPYLSEYDILIGSRNLKESDIQVRQPILRSKLGQIFPLLARAALLEGVKDSQCGFKLFKKEVIKPVFQKQTLNRFCFDVEILHIAKKLGFRIREIPIVWLNALGSKVKTFRDSPAMLRDLWKIKRNDQKGCYEIKR